MIQDGTVVFTSVEGIIRQMPIPFFVYVLRTYWRNTIILAHNILIFPAVCLVVGKPLSLTSLLALPGFLIVSINLLWIAFVIGIFCTRFRDCVQIVNSLLQIVFYVAPIIWMPSALPARGASMILDPNPVYHMLCLIRDPILGIAPTMANCFVPVLMAVFG